MELWLFIEWFNCWILKFNSLTVLYEYNLVLKDKGGKWCVLCVCIFYGRITVTLLWFFFSSRLPEGRVAIETARFSDWSLGTFFGCSFWGSTHPHRFSHLEPPHSLHCTDTGRTPLYWCTGHSCKGSHFQLHIHQHLPKKYPLIYSKENVIIPAMIKTFKGKNTCSEFQRPLLAQPNIRNSNENLVCNNRSGFKHLSKPIILHNSIN